MIPRDEHYARNGPQLDKHHPPGVAEGAGVVIGHAHPQGGASLLPGLVDQGRWDNVLDARPGVTAGDADQELQAVGGHGDCRGRDQGQQGEDGCAGPVGVAPTLGQEEWLKVVAQCYRDDREVGAQGEYREQGQEDVQRKQKPVVGGWWLKKQLSLKLINLNINTYLKV